MEDLLDIEGGTSLPETDLQILHGLLLTINGQQAYFNNQTTQAIDLCNRALALVPSTWKYVPSGAMLYLGVSLQSSGQALDAERLLLAEYESCADKGDAYPVRILLALCFIYFNTSQLAQARKIAEVMRQAADSRGLSIGKSWGNYFSRRGREPRARRAPPAVPRDAARRR